MVDLVTHNLNTLPAQSATRQENYAAALSELLKHMEWIEVQKQLDGKESYFDNRSDIPSKRIELMVQKFELTEKDRQVINVFFKLVTDISLQYQRANTKLPCIKSPEIVPADESSDLKQSVVVIGVVGFCAKEFAWDELLIKALEKIVQEIKKEDKIPIFLCGGDKRGVGARVLQIAEKENVPIIAMLTEQGLVQSDDKTLIVPREQIIAVENINGRGDGWSTSTEIRGLEFMALLCEAINGRMIVAAGGKVGKKEMLHGLELNVPIRYLDLPAKDLTPAELSNPGKDNEYSLTQLLIATERLFYSEKNACFVNRADGGNGEILMRVPSYTGAPTRLAPPAVARSQSSQ